MKKLTLALATAAVLATAAPAMAFVGVHVGPVGVGIGGPGPYYSGNCGSWNNYCNGPAYYDYYDGPNVVIGGGWHGHPGYHGHWHH